MTPAVHAKLKTYFKICIFTTKLQQNYLTFVFYLVKQRDQGIVKLISFLMDSKDICTVLQSNFIQIDIITFFLFY